MRPDSSVEPPFVVPIGSCAPGNAAQRSAAVTWRQLVARPPGRACGVARVVTWVTWQRARRRCSPPSGRLSALARRVRGRRCRRPRRQAARTLHKPCNAAAAQRRGKGTPPANEDSVSCGAMALDAAPWTAMGDPNYTFSESELVDVLTFVSSLNEQGVSRAPCPPERARLLLAPAKPRLSCALRALRAA